MFDKYLEKRRFEMSLSRQPLPMKIGEIILYNWTGKRERW